MKTQQSVIGNRYVYAPQQPIRETANLSQYRTYDKVTKRDLLLQIHLKPDPIIDALREHKHPFILFIFDKVEMDDGRVSYIFQSGVQASLYQSLRKIRHFNQEDALVVFKYILLMIKEIHSKGLLAERICLQNVLICNYALIKLGHFAVNEDFPVQCWSPERHQEKPLSVKSDIFSLGVVLYHLLYGQYPFKGEDQSEIFKKIKSKSFKLAETKSPLQIVISRELHFLTVSMLDYYEQNRPDLETILASDCFKFDIQTDIQAYLKPKGSIVPESFHKKYLIIRPSKITIRYGQYYTESSFLVFNVQEKNFMTMYTPDVRMFQAEPRKAQSYYQKIRALQKNYRPNNCQYIIKVDDIQKFRQEPILTTQYCNQGNLFNYLEKRKIYKGWLTEPQTNVLMYLMAIALKQMKSLGISSLHTINYQRIMIHHNNIKLRQPGLLTPIIEKKLHSNEQIDFFAPQLKEKLDFVQLDKSDIWSYGITYIYLLTGQMPKLDEQHHIDLSNLRTNRKNINIIGKCLDINVKKRIQLQDMRMQSIDEHLLNDMILQYKQQMKLEQNQDKMVKQIVDNSDLQSNAQEIRDNKKVMFKKRKKRLFKHYNKIISQSTTTPCRLIIKTIFGLILLWLLFFGIFFVNGGLGLLRTNFYRSITLQVPFNYGTSLANLTILSTNGALIASNYSDYSYEQFTTNLRCNDDKYGDLWDFANGSQTVFCLFGFIWAILISILYVIQTHKLDLPAVILRRKQKQSNKQIFHFVVMHLVMPSLLFTFFYTFAFEYILQTNPCFGIQNLAYPTFTSVDAILTGNLGKFFLNVFLTVVLWAVLMFVYGFTSFFIKKVSANIYEWIGIIVTGSFMLIFTIICRVGFGISIPIEPTWTYKMNLDITQHYFGLFGFFPQILWIIIVICGVLIDFIFWFFLKIGLRPVEQQDITRVAVKAKFERLDTKQKDGAIEKSNIYMIENAYDFQRFD